MIDPEKRLFSLDLFRGIIIALMMIVNNQGDWSYVYTPFRHVSWHGWHLADLVFPSFLFIMGVAIPFSFSRRKENNESGKGLARKIIIRSVILIILGLVLNFLSEPSWKSFRIPGVLQRIGLCYFFASVIFLSLKKKGRVIITAAILVLYWLMLKYIPVPGFGAGVLEAKGCLPWFIDKSIFAGHTYKYALVPGFDPEGLLSTLPAVSTSMLGILTGLLLRAEFNLKKKTVMILIFSAGCMVLGMFWNTWFPINKNIWSSSFVLLMAGIDIAVLFFSYVLTDIRKYRLWARPFLAFGLNSIAAYFLSSAAGKMTVKASITLSGGSEIQLKNFIYQKFFSSWLAPYNASLFYAVAFMMLWAGIMFIFYKKKWFIKI